MTTSRYCPLLKSAYISESRLVEGPEIDCYTITTNHYLTREMDIVHSKLDRHMRRHMGNHPLPKNWTHG